MTRTEGPVSGTRSVETTERLLEGAIDIHVHAGPHLMSSPRRRDPFEVAEEAAAAHMRALVYMDVFGDSSGTAWLVERRVSGVEVFGGIILNSGHGGLNARAVRTALSYGSGARFVQFGAHSTRFMAEREAKRVDGKLVPFVELYPEFVEREMPRTIDIPLRDPVPTELDSILRLVAEHPSVYLNTGHVSAEEALRVVELASRYGIEKIVVAGYAVEAMTTEQQQAAADAGAYLEYSFGQFVNAGAIPKTHYYAEADLMFDGIVGYPTNHPELHQLGERLREIGPEHVVLDTDYGVWSLPSPVEGMRQFIACLLDLGLSSDEVKVMTSKNPAELLGLPPAN